MSVYKRGANKNGHLYNARQMAILVWHYFTVKKLVSFRYPFPAVMSYWMSL